MVDYFRIYGDAEALSTCVLDDPRHIVLFSARGHTAVVMNQLFDIDPVSAGKVVRAILASTPGVRRVRFNGSRVEFDAVPLPTRILETSCDVVIPLPSTVDAYLAGLSRGTRQKLRSYVRAFSRAFPDHQFKVYASREIDPPLVHRIVQMNRERMDAKGEACLHSRSSETQLAEFLRGTGFATAVIVDGHIVAGALGSRVGTQRYLHVQSFDNRFAEYHLGLVSLFKTIAHCIDDGDRALHLLWGKSEYKRRLGGVEEQVRAASVYRSQVWRFGALDDLARCLMWNWRRGRLAASRAAVLEWASSTLLHRSR